MSISRIVYEGIDVSESVPRLSFIDWFHIILPLGDYRSIESRRYVRRIISRGAIQPEEIETAKAMDLERNERRARIRAAAGRRSHVD